MTKRARREARHDFAGANPFVCRASGTAHEHFAPARRLLRRRHVERPLDADGANVREEGEAGRRAGLQRVPYEMLIEIEQRREVGREERGADRMLARRRLEADGHLRDVAERISRYAPAASAARRRAASTLARCLAATVCFGRAESAAALPVHQSQSLAVEQHVELFARHRAESGRRHVVAEDRRHRHRVFAVGWEHVLDEHPAARAEREPFDVILLRRVFGRAVHDKRWRRRLADGEAADFSRG